MSSKDYIYTSLLFGDQESLNKPSNHSQWAEIFKMVMESVNWIDHDQWHGSWMVFSLEVLVLIVVHISKLSTEL